MFLTSVTENQSLTIFLAIIIPILVIGAGYFVFRSVIKENKRYKEEVVNYIEGVQNKKEINTSISSYITRQSLPFSLIMVDIDKFSDIIENFGRDEANKIIKNMALHILDILPKRVEMARIDTDKFLIFMKSEYSKEEALALTRKILSIIIEPITIFGDNTINVTASLSVCLYPNHGNTLKQLMESLDIAMYICKRNGGNQYLLYTEETGAHESENLEYYKQIKKGIKNKEFTLYYQPIINCKTKEFYGFEGLLRWNHPELGLLSPYKFISIMEQSGDIKWVGEWGLESLIKEYLEVKRQGFITNFVCTMNLSPKQLSDASLAIEFQKIIRKYRVNASSIVLEIEEFALFDKHDTIKKNIKDLKELGFKIAVDGFGLDFNGIKRLEEMQVDIVKLDKEYMDPDTDSTLKQQFTNLLIDFASTRNITIIAEGVEDVEVLNSIRNQGIDIVQGYNFSKPLEAKDLEEYIKSNDWVAHM